VDVLVQGIRSMSLAETFADLTTGVRGIRRFQDSPELNETPVQNGIVVVNRDRAAAADILVRFPVRREGIGLHPLRR